MSQDTIALHRLEAEIKCGRIRVYRNPLGQACICFNAVEEDPPGAKAGVHLRMSHNDSHASLSEFIWRTEKILLDRRGVGRIMLVLQGLTLANSVGRPTDPALLELLETEPTVAVITEFMQSEKRSKLENTMESLWKELHGFAQQRDLLAIGKKRFPRGSNVLSRSMTCYKDQLMLLGIRFSMTRSNGCRVVLERLDDPASEPSAEPSAPKPPEKMDLLPRDANKAMLANLAAKRRQQLDLSPPTEGIS